MGVIALFRSSTCCSTGLVTMFAPGPNNFIAASANITEMDEEAKKYPIVTQVEKGIELNSVMSNSFGFGGTNATLVFEKV